ncbi:MAG: hypothetical protein JW889_13560 [Verrucomicrobia bacterium]|nr:hypothetical protein [Verrucomicrobiota bacterium]
MDTHTHNDDRPRPAELVSPGSGAAEQALAGALRTMFGALRVVMIIVLVALVFSNTRFLRQNQRAVILRFGRIVGAEAARVHGPGLVFAWPQPIDEIIVVDAARVQTLDVDDFMYRASAREGGTEQLGETLDPALDGYTVTGDANILHTLWRIEYQIDDVVKYVLNVSEPERLIRASLAAAVVHASVLFTVDEALIADVSGFIRAVEERLQARLDAADSGIRIVGVRTQERREPVQTSEAFQRLVQAGQERDQMLQEAQRYSQQVLAAAAGDAAEDVVRTIKALADAEEAPEAERDPARVEILRANLAVALGGAAGEVAKVLSEAKTYRVRVREDAMAMAATFDALNRKYRENPEIFVRQIYQDSIQDVLGKAGYAFVVRLGKEVRIMIEPPRKKTKPAEEEAGVIRTPEERARTRGTGP